MSKNINHLQHVKSNVVENGGPKLPSPSILAEGELAVNYAKGYETISIKNSDNEIVTFSSDNYFIEKKLGSGFTNENSAKTVTEAIAEKTIDVDQVLDETTSASTNAVASQAVYDALVKDELVWTNAYVTLSGNLDTHISNTAVHVTQEDKDKLDAIGTMAYENASGYSSSTEVNTALNNKADINHGHTSDAISSMTSYSIASESSAIETGDTLNEAIGKLEKKDSDIMAIFGSGFTGENSANTVTKVIEDNEMAISSSLNDLNTRKMDVSAYTPTDLTNYYTKSQTSGATELAEAFANIHFDVDQVIDSGTSASTNAVSTNAVFTVIKDNEEVMSAALADLNYRLTPVMSVVEISADTISSCVITGSAHSGLSQIIIYTNSTQTKWNITIPTTYTTPDGEAIELECPPGAYREVNYLNIDGTVYARGL